VVGRRSKPRRIATLIALALVVACGGPAPSAQPSEKAPGVASIGPAGSLGPSGGSGSSTTTPTAPGASGSIQPTPLAQVNFPPLPTPAPLPPGDRDAAAASIAATIDANPDASTLPALIMAFQASGIPVSDVGGGIIPSQEPTFGIAVTDWELRLLVSGGAAGRTSLSDLGASMRMITGLADADVASMILNGIKASASGPAGSSRFWARIVSDMGTARADPSDPLSAQRPEDVFLDSYQVQLVVRRIAAELVRFGMQRSGEFPQSPNTGATWSGEFAGRAMAAAAPCRYDPFDERVVSTEEVVTSTAVGQLLDFIGTLVPQVEKASTIVGWAGIITDVATVALMYLALDIQISIDPEPLVRTTHQRPATGNRGDLRAIVKFDLNEKAEVVNCLRTTFASVGVTFNVPQSGPISGAEVSWKGRDGFTPYEARIVQFVGGDPEHSQTDAAGLSTIGVEGVGQKDELADPPLSVAVDKEATVQLQVQLQKADIFNDLLSALGTGGNLTVFSDPEPFQVPIEFIIEMAKRVRWFAQAHYTFKVTDWAADYMIDETFSGTSEGGAYSITFTGTKCDGPVGEWILDETGTITAAGGVISISGTIVVNVDKTLKGKWGANVHVQVNGQPAGGDQLSNGTAVLAPGPPPTLVMTQTGGAAHGFAFGHNSYVGAKPGETDFPVHIGACTN
jgi:hypothetical protein